MNKGKFIPQHLERYRFKFEPLDYKTYYNSLAYYNTLNRTPRWGRIDEYVPKVNGGSTASLVDGPCAIDTVLNHVLCLNTNDGYNLYPSIYGSGYSYGYTYSYVDYFQKKIVLSMVNKVIQKDTCTEITATLKKDGVELTSDRNYNFSLDDIDGIGHFYPDESCIVELKKLTLPEGASQVRFFYKAPNTSTRSKMVRLRLKNDQLSSTILSSEVVGLPIGLNLLNRNYGVIGNNCQPFLLSLIDESGYSVVMTEDYVISSVISGNPTNFNQYSDAICTPGNETNSVTIKKGQSSANLYVKTSADCNAGFSVVYTAPGVLLSTQTRGFFTAYCGGSD